MLRVLLLRRGCWRSGKEGKGRNAKENENRQTQSRRHVAHRSFIIIARNSRASTKMWEKKRKRVSCVGGEAFMMYLPSYPRTRNQRLFLPMTIYPLISRVIDRQLLSVTRRKGEWPAKSHSFHGLAVRETSEDLTCMTLVKMRH